MFTLDDMLKQLIATWCMFEMHYHFSRFTRKIQDFTDSMTYSRLKHTAIEVVVYFQNSVVLCIKVTITSKLQSRRKY